MECKKYSRLALKLPIDMRKILTILGLLACGMAIGAIITYVVEAESFQQFVDVEQQTMLFKTAQTCDQAYFTQSPDIAIWQIEHYLADLESASGSKENIRIDNLNLFVAHARLGKLYEKLGKHTEEEHHLSQAMTNYNLACGQSSITNESSIFANLEAFDAKALKQFNHPATSDPKQQ